jgi:hypothetical protein
MVFQRYALSSSLPVAASSPFLLNEQQNTEYSEIDLYFIDKNVSFINECSY